MTLYIFEGGDLSGKSTLAKYISKKFKIPFIQRIKVTQRMFKDFIDLKGEIETSSILKNLDFKKHDYVADRFLLSDIIYNKVYKRKYSTQWAHDAFKNLKNYKLFYVRAPICEIEKRFKTRGDMLIDFNKLSELHTEYEKFIFKQVEFGDNQNIYIIENIDLNTAKSCISKIIRGIKHEKR